MRVANFYGLMSASLLLMCLSLIPGLARATDSQPLDAAEQAFLIHAMSDNAAQIAMAKLALQKSKNPHVIALANAVIQERTSLDTRLAELLARTDGQTGAKQLPVSHDAAIDGLQSLNGDSFDKSFAGLLVRSHCRLISAYEVMKMTSTDLALKAIAHDAIPAMQGDLTVAMAVLRSPDWAPSAHQQVVLSAADPHAMKTPVFWEPISLVAAPW